MTYATMDGIIDTVSAEHPLLPLIGLVKPHRKIVCVGAPKRPPQLPIFPLFMGRKMVGGSLIGGMKETQEMIDFAVKHNITADIEVIPMDYFNTAMDRLVKADVKYRFVIDIANSLTLLTLSQLAAANLNFQLSSSSFVAAVVSGKEERRIEMSGLEFVSLLTLCIHVSDLLYWVVGYTFREREFDGRRKRWQLKENL